MGDFKDSYIVTVSAIMANPAVFTSTINLPFEATHVIVKSVCYDADHKTALLRSPFVQGGILAVWADTANLTPNTKFKLTQQPKGTISFDCVTPASVIKADMTAGQLAVQLEFVK